MLLDPWQVYKDSKLPKDFCNRSSQSCRQMTTKDAETQAMWDVRFFAAAAGTSSTAPPAAGRKVHRLERWSEVVDDDSGTNTNPEQEEKEEEDKEMKKDESIARKEVVKPTHDKEEWDTNKKNELDFAGRVEKQVQVLVLSELIGEVPLLDPAVDATRFAKKGAEDHIAEQAVEKVNRERTTMVVQEVRHAVAQKVEELFETVTQIGDVLTNLARRVHALQQKKGFNRTGKNFDIVEGHEDMRATALGVHSSAAASGVPVGVSCADRASLLDDLTLAASQVGKGGLDVEPRCGGAHYDDAAGGEDTSTHGGYTEAYDLKVKQKIIEGAARALAAAETHSTQEEKGEKENQQEEEEKERTHYELAACLFYQKDDI